MTHDAKQLDAFEHVLSPGSDLPIGQLGVLRQRQMRRFGARAGATMGLSQAGGVRMALAAESPLRPPAIRHGQAAPRVGHPGRRAFFGGWRGAAAAATFPGNP